MFRLRNRPSPTARRLQPSLGASFTKNEIASMAGLGVLVDIEPGRDLMTEGTEGTHAYFIISGTAAVTRSGLPADPTSRSLGASTSDAATVAVVSAGDLIGERALVTGSPRNATVTALEPLQVLQFDVQQFAWLRLESPKVKALCEELLASRA